MAETLDIVQLRTFVAIADCGGFGRAASALHLSQPTVSQHVRSLERKLQLTLVEKVGRQAQFTQAGDRLLVQARRVLRVHDEALLALDATNEQPIVVGSTETAADQILPELLTTVRDAFPGRQVQFQIDRSTQMSEAVTRGVIDIAIILGMGGDLPGRQIGTLPLNWYASPGWEHPPEGDAIPLVAYVDPCGMRQRALQQLGAFGHAVEVVAESTSLEGVIAAARAGLGVAVLPTTGRQPQGLVIRRDLPELGSINVRLVSRRGVAADVEETALAALEPFYAAQRRTGRPTVERLSA